MNDGIGDGLGDLTAEINGREIGGVSYAQVTARREYVAKKGFGEGGAGSHPTGDSFQIVLHRVLMPGDTRDFFSLKNFYLTVTEGGQATVYSDCRWVQIKDVYHTEQGHTQELTLIASRRRLMGEGICYGE